MLYVSIRDHLRTRTSALLGLIVGFSSLKEKDFVGW
jgi:hypothetical protein